MEKNVVVIKFLNGEEVVGNLVQETIEDYTLEDAFGVTVVQDPQNPVKSQVHLYAISNFSESKNSTFNKATVMLRPRKAKDALEKMYLSKISGIVLTSTSTLLKG